MHFFDITKGMFVNADSTSEEDFLAINWNVTGECLNSCCYCYGSDIRSMIGMSNQKLEAFLRNLVALQPDLVVLTGGEPLLFPSLPYAIGYLLNEGINIILDTSAVLDLSFLCPYLDKIHTRISLDSVDYKINEATRKSSIANSTEVIKKRIVEMVACEYAVSVQTTITDHNCTSLMDLASFLTTHRVKNWRLSFVIPHTTELEHKMKKYLKMITTKCPELYIRVSNHGKARNDHIILVDPQGNICIRNSFDNSKKHLGHLAEKLINKQVLLENIDVEAHKMRYFYKGENDLWD